MKNKTHPTVAITGASGFLGSQLVDHFLSKKWNVVGLVRNAKSKRVGKNLVWREYDITDTISPQTLSGVDVLIHAAYVKLDPEHPNAFELNVSGAKAIIKASTKANVGQLVFISSMSAHEDAISTYGKQKLAIEDEFLKTSRASVLRCGLIIGNGGIVKEMAQFMKSKHAVPLIGGGRQPLQIIGVDDLAAAIYSVAEKSLLGRFTIATPRVYEYRDFYKALADELGIRVLYVPVPYGILEAIFGLASAAHIKLGVGQDNLKGLKMLKKMPTEQDLKRIGIKPMDLKTALSKAKLTS